MQFDQLTIDTQFSDFPQPVTYRSLDNDGKVYCKIDWLTVMFFDCSMNDVLRWLHLDNCVSDFCSKPYQLSRGYDDVFKFSFNNIVLETSCFNFYGNSIDLDIFDIVVPKIRLELSGSGLDFLRSIGVDFDSHRFSVPSLPEGGSYHFTRCDWAYDFINYKPEFVDKLIDHINTHKLPSERVPLASTRGAISAKIVTGGQKTVYLGSPQSDRTLRVYDKRMQHVDLATGVYKKENPYGNPDSWFRIEWQTRNKFANDLVHGVDENGSPSDFKCILKDIFDRYAFADGTVKRDRSCVDFWLELFNWQDLERRIIQNAKYVQYQTPNERLIRSFKYFIRKFGQLYSWLGPEAVASLMNEDLVYLQRPENSKKFTVFLNQINELDGLNISSDDHSHGYFNNCGHIAFRW